ncbi:MAG: peptidoglycan-binding protein [Candidatus Vogelbacteria bacterium]|nr:peptidoglycan-binding protein [Candidatus Vogelbacteria bacterium]
MCKQAITIKKITWKLLFTTRKVNLTRMKKYLSSLLIVTGLLVFSVAHAQSAMPTISSITPNQGTQNTSVTIYGTNLSGATNVEFYTASGQLSASLVPSSSSATNVNFTISGPFVGNVDPGTYQVSVVTNLCPGGCDSNRLSFTLNAPSANAPTISNISPGQGTANTSITIYGTNISEASRVEFYNQSGQLNASLTPSAVTATSLMFTISGPFVGNVDPGTYQLKIVTPFGTSNGMNFVFNTPSVNAPTISSISPAQGTQNTNVTIYGTNLSGTTNIEFYTPDGRITGGLYPSSVSAQNVIFTVSGLFAANMTPGTYQVSVVTNACPGGCNSNKLSFTLNAPVSNLPTISTISPNQGTLNKNVTIYGTNLSGATNVEFYTSSGQVVASLVPPSVSATNVGFTISSSFVGNVDPGIYQVAVVTNACPGGCSSNRLSFTLNPLPVATTPQLKLLSPSDNGTALIGSSLLVSWQSSGFTEGTPIRVDLKKYATGERYIIGNNLSLSGSFSWQVGTSLNGQSVSPGVYSMLICVQNTCFDDVLPLALNAAQQIPITAPSPNQQTPRVVTPSSSALPLTDDVDASDTASVCTALNFNLKYRSRDSQTNGEVTLLQQFLNDRGYLNQDPTGYFGMVTVAAVKQFQLVSSISPTGNIGPLSRAKIRQLSCSVAEATSPAATPSMTTRASLQAQLANILESLRSLTR